MGRPPYTDGSRIRQRGFRAGLTSTALTFDDAWFANSSHEYNYGLATACAILSAVCNSESQFYGSIDGAVPYAEKTLGALGFESARTRSF